MTGKVRAVVFDFDGTLVDTMGAFADLAAGVIRRRYGMSEAIARRRYIETSGLPFRQQLEVIFPGDARNDAAAAEFESAKEGSFFSESFGEDVRAVVTGLKALGVLAVVSSNNRQELIDRFVAREGVRFDAVLGAREKFFKGADHFGWVRAHLGVLESEMLFVGDSLVDGERAMSCGVRFVAKLGTFSAADFERRLPGVQMVSSLVEVLAML